MEYIINGNLTIKTNEEGKLPYMATNILVAMLCGSSYQGVFGEQGNILMTQPNGEEWIIPHPDMSLEERKQSNEKIIIPIENQSFLQTIYANYPMTVNSVMSRNGYIVGIWRAESMTMLANAMNNDDYRSGLIQGLNEPIYTEAYNLKSAIINNALVQAGFGKKAIFVFDDILSNPKLLFLTDASISILRNNQYMYAHTVLEPKLDKYAMLSKSEFIPDIIYGECKENAVSLVKIQKMDYERSLQNKDDVLI